MALQRASVERPLANAVAEQAKVSEGKLAEFAKELLREEDKVVEALHSQLHRPEAAGVNGARSKECPPPRRSDTAARSQWLRHHAPRGYILLG